MSPQHPIPRSPSPIDTGAAVPPDAEESSELAELESGAIPSPAVAPIDPAQRLINRDLSWLEFNRRVLAQATDPRTPLLTRVKFLGIFSSNLDEFFMKRVGYLKQQLVAGMAAYVTPEGYTPRPLLFAIRTLANTLMAEQAACYEQELVPRLAEHGVHILRYGDLSEPERTAIDVWYQVNVFPILTPLAVDPGHRFPFISNLSENIGVMVSQPGEHERHFARVKIPDVLPRLIRVSDGAEGVGGITAISRSGEPPTPENPLRVISLDEVVRNNLDDLFPGMQIQQVMSFRVTRNAAVEVGEPETEDMLQSVEKELRMRRFAQAVRLETPPGPPPAVLKLVVDSLRLESEDVYERGGPMDYADLFAIAELDMPHLKEKPWQGVPPPRLAPGVVESDADVFGAIRERDILLHHPYESFNASIERFLGAAARDPDVLAIKQTIYRTSPDSPFVASLVRAAEDGKQVACLVELRARFDEHKNVRFARMLEKAGVHVAYGVVGFKTHCKTSLVVRRESDGLRSYAHLGTGNYNPSTAQLYTDLGLFTCDPRICADVMNLFNYLTGRSMKRDYDQILVAPFTMRDAFTKLIDREIALARVGRPARIIAKMNSLEDLKITNKLYEASGAGVEVTLIVRGFCCLRPGIAGLSENIRVISVVGRFLEHSRLYHFSAGKADPVEGDWYISSADWMYRNLSTRVEAAVPVKDTLARARLKRIVDLMLRDQRCAWDLNADGTYTRRMPGTGVGADSAEALGTFQALMREAAESRAGG